MAGKTVLVTGASDGIGLAASEGLAELGASLIMVARNAQKLEAAKQTVERAAPGAAVDVMVADLSSQREIRALAAQVKARHARLDVLVNNVGGIFHARTLSVDGLEMTFALNHLGYFLLTELLLDLLKASAPARIVNVASMSGYRASIDFEDLMKEKRYRRFNAYGQSKLANMLFTRELARRLEGTGVTVNSLHPGMVASSFGNTSAFFKWGLKLISPIANTPKQGASTVVYLASSPDVQGVTSAHFVKSKRIPWPKPALDEATGQRLWRVSEELTGLSAPERRTA